MKTPHARFASLTLATSLFALTHIASANEALWIGTNGISVTTNWSDLANFRNIGAGGTGPTQNAVVFDDSTGVADATDITSVVDVNENPFSLAFTNFNTFQNLLIASGKTLLVGTGGFTNGSTVTFVTAVSPTVNISGTNASLVISNGNIFIGDSYPGTSGTTTINMSNLDNFVGTNLTRILLGTGTVRESGTLFLAKTNLVNVSGTTSPQLDVGDNTSNNGAPSTLDLGESNLLCMDNIAVGRSKESGSSIRFAPSFTNGTATAYIRGHDGVSAVATWSLGDGNGISGTSTAPKGTVDFSGGVINVAVSNMWIGRPSITSATAPTGAGTLTMTAGNFTVMNNLTNAVTVTPSTGGPGTATGTININGGTLTVNNNLMMAILGSGTSSSTGTLNINYGIVQVSNLVVGTGTSAINMVGGELIVTNAVGTSAQPVGSMSVSNSTIQVAASLTGVPVNVNSFTADGNTGDTNFIDIVSLPAIATYPATFTIIQSPNSLNLQNGNFNFALGGLPNGFFGYLAENGNGNAVQLIITNGPSQPDVWTGADISAHHDTNWSDGLNWASGTAPGATSLVFFDSSSASLTSAISAPGSGVINPAAINNIVDNNFSIASLAYTNINGSYQNTFINNGESLSVGSLGFSVGSATEDFGNTTGGVSISGPNGTLMATNPASSIYVGLGDSNSGAAPEATLDMSGLGSFDANVANLLAGVGGFANGFTVPQAAGIIYLAKTNFITASSAQPDNSDTAPLAIEVGDVDTQAGTVNSALYLGVSNMISADNISVGRQLASGGIFFNPAFTNINPTAYFRGASGNAVLTWAIGDGAVNTSSATPFGTNDFTGGTINAVVNTLYVAKPSTANFNASAVTGTLTFTAGTITATTVDVSYNAAASDNNVYSYGVGTVNVSGTGALTANTINLAYTAGPLQGGSPVGTLNITNGGAVLANNIIAGTNNANSVINVNDGTLIVSNIAGVAQAPLTTLDVTNATLDLAVAPLTPTIDVANLNLDGVGASHDNINILSLPPIATYPVTFTIVTAFNGINAVGGTFNFALGTLPNSPGQPYAGNITESSDNHSVLLTVTSGPIGQRPTVTWSGADVPNNNTNWSDSLNWILPGAPTPTDNVIFDSTTGQGSSELGTVGAGAGGLNFSSVNNFVDTDFTISTLTYSNVNGSYQNTYIADGASLTVTNTAGLTVGSETADLGGTSGIATIAGAKGTLNVNNASTNSTVFVGLGSGSATSENATLDLSGLGTFNATVGRVLMGVGSSSEGVGLARMSGTIFLAQTNNITATIAVAGAESNDTGANAVALDIGDDDGNNGAPSALYLGQSNVIFADAIATGRQKESAGMSFNPAFVNPTAYFRGHDGVSAVSSWDIADGVVNSGTVATTATNDFTGGTVNALVTSMFIGRAPNVASDTHNNGVTGILNFGAGIINVGTLNAGYEPAASSPFGVGTVNVFGPGSLIAGNLNLGYAIGGAGATSTSGTLNITGGLVQANAIGAGTNSVSAINMLGGALTVATTAGSVNAPLGTLSLSNSTLTLPAATTGCFTVTTLNLDGQTTTTNVINISSVAPASVGSELPLIHYGTLNLAGGTFNVQAVLSNGYAGYVTNDTSSDTVAIVLTTVPNFQPPVVTSIIHSGNNLVINGTNGFSGENYTVLTSTNITLPKAQWTRLVTNSFNANGSFSFTNAINPNTPQQYFLFEAP